MNRASITCPASFSLLCCFEDGQAVDLFGHNDSVPFFLQERINSSNSWNGRCVVGRGMTFMDPCTMCIFICVFNFQNVQVSFRLHVGFLVSRANNGVSFAVNYSNNRVVEANVSAPIFS